MSKTSSEPPCQTCHGARMYTRGSLPDGRPRWVVCYSCGGEGPVAEPAPFAPEDIADRKARGERWDRQTAEYEASLERPGEVEEPSLTDALLRAGYTHRRAESAALGKHDIVDATGEVVATLRADEAWAWLEQQRKPSCFESRGPLKHEVVAAMNAATEGGAA